MHRSSLITRLQSDYPSYAFSYADRHKVFSAHNMAYSIDKGFTFKVIAVKRITEQIIRQAIRDNNLFVIDLVIN